VGKHLNQADLAQDIDRPIDRAQTHAWQLNANTFEQRLSGQVRAVVEGLQDSRPLFG
jgi:hypothetical protein